MRITVHAQAIRRFDAPCGVYLRDEQGRMAPPDADITVEAVPYRGGSVQESWPASVTERGRLEWVVPAGTQLARGLYSIRGRAGDRLIALGLLEVV